MFTYEEFGGKTGEGVCSTGDTLLIEWLGAKRGGLTDMCLLVVALVLKAMLGLTVMLAVTGTLCIVEIV